MQSRQMKNRIAVFLVCFLCGHGEAARGFKFHLVEEIKTRASGLITLENQDVLKSRSQLKEAVEKALEAAKLHTQAKTREALGNRIFSDLYKAKARLADVETEFAKLSVESSIADRMNTLAHKTENQQLHSQVKKYITQIIGYRWEATRALTEARSLLYASTAALYEASGKQDEAGKYKKAAELTRKSEQFLSEANKHLSEENRTLADLYQAKGFLAKAEADLHITEEPVKARRFHLQAQIYLYEAQEAHYLSLENETAARKFREAANHMKEANMYFNQAGNTENPIEARDYELKANREIAAAKAAETMKTGCRRAFFEGSL